MLLADLKYGNWLPPQLSEHGGQIDRLLDYLHVFMVVLFVPWLIFFIYCLMRFRGGNGRAALYTPIKAKVSKYAEIGVAIIEVVLLVGFSMPVWAEYKNDPPARDDRLEVRVVAEQFQWDFHYPGADGVFGRTKASLIDASNPLGLDGSDPAAADDVWTINDFHLPTGRDIYLRLSSKDVIHSFAVPALRVKQDAIPGMEIPIWFKIAEWATDASLRERMKTTFSVDGLSWYRVRHYVATRDHASRSGEIVLAKGADMGADLAAGKALLERLRVAGVTELELEPYHAMEVICAQLCGNSHFKMKAQLVAHDQAGFAQWLAEQSKQPEFEQEF
jgi:cytochrome c oxidase subunit 2